MIGSLHVLLVDDDPLTALNTKRALGQSAEVSKVTIACDGRDALDHLERGTFARDRLVILTDLNMPRMSGLELAAAIRDEPTLCELPVLVLTTSPDQGDRTAAALLHVAGYFVKSATCPLVDGVRTWLRAYGAAARLAPVS